MTAAGIVVDRVADGRIPVLDADGWIADRPGSLEPLSEAVRHAPRFEVRTFIQYLTEYAERNYLHQKAFANARRTTESAA